MASRLLCFVLGSVEIEKGYKIVMSTSGERSREVAKRATSAVLHALRDRLTPDEADLPMVDGDRVVGILTGTDMLRVFQDVPGGGVLSKPYRWAFAYR